MPTDAQSKLDEMAAEQRRLMSVPGWPTHVDGPTALEAVREHLRNPCKACERRSYKKIASCIKLPHRYSGVEVSLEGKHVRWAIKLLGAAARKNMKGEWSTG